ncbi:MAG: 4Fe-4S dicluster domain-containing protein [Deltaproteobacteria bacterium]|nr:4Fe-4S dicluster domain-containing protein [Deltaproteobacteria bacterium]
MNVTLKIDGREVQAEEGAFVLQVAREAGAEIPTLCHHDDLEPVGACRLCMVEVTHPDWKGWKTLVTACIYPVSAGLEISTHNEAVLSARRGVLGLLAARVPEAPRIQELAAKYAVAVTRFEHKGDDDCILCGLCTRVCETYATGAIVTYGRGSEKHVGGFASEAPQKECVGCGACAAVCPTGELALSRAPGEHQIWGLTFSEALAVVDTARCIGCGACEQACPFFVARIALGADGQLRAVIPEAHCRGCGACIGACPTGAIDQRGFEFATLGEEVAP